MEWLILCLAVPAIVVPVVLLWGFVGCDLVFKLGPVSDIMAPVSLVATPRSGTAVSLSWQNIDPKAVRFQVERLDPGAADFAKVADNLTEPIFEDAGLTEGLIYTYRVRAAGNDGPYSDPSKTVPVDLAYKTAFERTAAEFAQGVNQTGIIGYCLVERIVGTPASPRLLRSGTSVKISVRGSTVGDLKINQIFISRPNTDAGAKDWYSDPADLTLVASDVLVPANTPVTVGPTALNAVNSIYILDNTKDLIIAFDTGTPGNARFGALIPPTASTSYAKAGVQEADKPTRSTPDSTGAQLHLVEKIEVLLIARSEA